MREVVQTGHGSAQHPARSMGTADADGSRSDPETAAQLQDLLVDQPDVRTFLQELAELAGSTLSAYGTTYCGITLQRNRSQQFTVASSDDLARHMDEVQYDHDDGPCLSALRTDREVFIADVTRDGRWPEFMTHIAQHGVGAMFCLPLRLEGSARAALNLYADDATVFTGPFKDLARSFALQASQALRMTVRVAHHAAAAEDLRAVLETRTEIDLAVGILMGRNNCSQKEAFDLLRKQSNDRNIKVRSLAADIVRTLNGSTPDTHFDHS